MTYFYIYARCTALGSIKYQGFLSSKKDHENCYVTIFCIVCPDDTQLWFQPEIQ